MHIKNLHKVFSKLKKMLFSEVRPFQEVQDTLRVVPRPLLPNSKDSKIKSFQQNTSLGLRY